MNQVVTELVIDGRGAETGSASYVRAMQVAQAAVDRLRDREDALKLANEASGASMITSSTSTLKAASAYDRLKASIDPVFAASKGLEKDILTLDRAVTRLGVSEQEAARVMDLVVLKHDAAAQAARRQAAEYENLARAGREAQAADRAQGSVNTTLGVRDPASFVGAARQSAGVFSSELDRLDQISQQKSAQIGQSFAANLESSLIAGTRKSARDAAAVFSSELDQMDEVARMRAVEAGSAFTSDLNARLGVGATTNSARASASVFAEADREAESYQQRLAGVRAQIDPLGAAVAQLNAELGEYAVMMQRGDISTKEFAVAQQMAQSRVDMLRAHIDLGQRNRQFGGNSFAAINSAQQFQDILITSMMGQSVPTIALQQGTQLGTAAMMAGGGGGAVGLMNALKSSVSALANPIMLGAVAFTAVTAAAIKFGSTVIGSGKNIEDVLKRHKEVIDEIAAAFPQAASAAKAYEDEAKKLPQSVVEADTAQQREDEQKLLTKRLDDLRLSLKVTGSDYGLFGAAGSQAFSDLAEDMQKGEAGAVTVQKRLGELRIDPELSDNAHKFALSLQETANEAAKLELQLGGTTAAASAFAGVTVGRGDEADNMTRYLAKNRETLRQMQIDRDVDMAKLYARSPSEQAAAARKEEEAKPVNPENESSEARNFRIQTAGAMAYAQALKQITDAQDDRKRSMEASLASQRLDIDLIGKTAGEVASAQFAFQALQQVREEAARNGITNEEEFQKIFGKELDLIDQAAAKMKEYADQAARAKLRDDLGFDRDQLGRSDIEQTVAGSLRQRGLSVDLGSQDAALIRSNELLKKQVDLWKDVRQTGMDAYSDIFDIALDGFDDWQQRLLDIGKDIAKNLFTLSAKNPFLNSQYPGANLPTIHSIGGLGGFFGTMLGLTPNPAAGAQSVGAMTVSAASVVVNGGLVGGTGGTLGNVTKMFNSGNDNYAPGAVTRAPLGDVAGYIKQAAIARNIDPDVALRVAQSEGLASGVWQSNVMKNGVREPSFGPFQLLKGGAGTGFPTGLGNAFMSDTGLDPANPANVRQGIDFALDHAATNGWGAWYGARAAGIGNREGLGGASAIGIDKFNKALGNATDGLGGFDSTITNSIKSLAGAFGSKESWASLLPQNFHANTTLSSYLGYTPQQSSGGGFLGSLLGGVGKFFSGLFGFADGTDYAPGGLARINERGGEIVDLPRGSRVIPNDISVRMADAASRGGGQTNSVVIHQTFKLDGAFTSKDAQAMARQSAASAVEEVKSNFQGWQVELQQSGGLS